MPEAYRSVFGAQARFPSDVVAIEGRRKEYVRTDESGNSIRFHFCQECGSTGFYQLDAVPDLIAIPIGAFADPGFPQPHVSVHEERRHAWLGLPDNVEHHY